MSFRDRTSRVIRRASHRTSGVPCTTATPLHHARAVPGGIRAAAVVALAALAAGCSTLTLPPRPTPAPTSPAPSGPTSAPGSTSGGAAAPSRPRSETSAASRTLLDQSRAARAAGNYGQASASLERALRIDPNNPLLYVELGELHLQTGNAAQAEAMARKALSLAGMDAALAARAERLLRAAR